MKSCLINNDYEVCVKKIEIPLAKTNYLFGKARLVRVTELPQETLYIRLITFRLLGIIWSTQKPSLKRVALTDSIFF